MANSCKYKIGYLFSSRCVGFIVVFILAMYIHIYGSRDIGRKYQAFIASNSHLFIGVHTLLFNCYQHLMPFMSSSTYMIDGHYKFTLIRMQLCKTTPNITKKMYIIAKTNRRPSLILKGFQEPNLELISCVFNVNLKHTCRH